MNPFKVGDIVVNTLGFQGRSVIFYQVTAVTKKTIVIQRIDYRYKGDIGGGVAIPILDSFLEEAPIRKQVKEDGTLAWESYNWWNKWDGAPEEVRSP